MRTETGQAGALGAPKLEDGRPDHIHELVEGWNYGARVRERRDRENYVNGDVEFLFEYGIVDAFRAPHLAAHGGKGLPDYVPLVVAKRILTSEGKIGDEGAHHCAGKFLIIARWNQELVLVRNVEPLD